MCKRILIKPRTAHEQGKSFGIEVVLSPSLTENDIIYDHCQRFKVIISEMLLSEYDGTNSRYKKPSNNNASQNETKCTCQKLIIDNKHTQKRGISIDDQINTKCTQKDEIIDSDSLSSLSSISCTDLFFSSFFSDDEDEKEQDRQELDIKDSEFVILGRSVSEKYDVLSQETMDFLRRHLPFLVQEENFFLKYSLARDGASLMTLLERARNSPRTILAIKTVDGDIFGAFTSSPWHDKGNNFYGSGESFLWRSNNDFVDSRDDTCYAEDLRVSKFSVEAFSWTGANRNVQMSNLKRLIVGGGEPEIKESTNGNSWGFGLTLDGDLSRGSSCSCATFGSPCLSKSPEREFFHVENVELWSLTPASTIEQAEKLEAAREFIYKHSKLIEI